MNYIVQKTDRKVRLKKRKSPSPISVKCIHNKYVKHFEDLQNNVLPKKLKEYAKTPTASLAAEIKDIKDRKEEVDYYLKTVNILDEYFLLDSGEQKEKEDSAESRKIEIVREYYEVLGMSLPSEYAPNLRLNTTDCIKCEAIDCMIETHEQGLVCELCGFVQGRQNISKTLSYNDRQTANFVVQLEYKRVDYFKQWMNQIQAKEQTEIPQEIIDTVIVELNKERVKNISKISASLVKRLLKKTNNSKYYEHIPCIIQKINKIPPLCIPEYIEQKLISMFEELQAPWSELKPKDRKNFFSYPYTFHKLCQLLGLVEYLPFFPLLKSRVKLHNQDILWKKIMEYLAKNPVKNENLTDVEWRHISSI